MSSKQQRAVKGKEHKVSRNEGWNVLSWDDLTEWAGPRSVSRGRAYQSQRRVDDLAISEDGWLLASVNGGERYAVTVWCDPERKKGERGLFSTARTIAASTLPSRLTRI